MRIQFKGIMCATDFSDFSSRTIPYGLALSKEFGAKLYVCHVIDLSSVAMYGEFQLDPVGQQQRIRQEAQEQLEALFGGQPIEWEPLIAVGQTADEIARQVSDKGIDLVISATRGRSGLKRLILGSVTERLMRTLSCPLLVIPGAEREPGDRPDALIRLSKILVGCDFSPDSSLALDYALSLAQEFESELHLVHVIEAEVYQEMLKPKRQAAGELRENLVREKLSAKLMGLVPPAASHWCTPQTALMEGQPFEALVEYAGEHQIDLIVLGVRGHGLVKTLLLGSTPDRVVRRSPCPVLTVGARSKEDRDG